MLSAIVKEMPWHALAWIAGLCMVLFILAGIEEFLAECAVKRRNCLTPSACRLWGCDDRCKHK